MVKLIAMKEREILAKSELKRCSMCREVMDFSNFGIDQARTDGLNHRCRTCESFRGKKYYDKGGRERQRAYYEAHRDTIKAYQRAYHEACGRPALRMCRKCGNPATSSRHHLCDGCRNAPRHRDRSDEYRRERERERPSSAARGYGSKHKKLREEWRLAVETGEIECARCGELIAPGQDWHLGHDDFNRSVYSGPEHAACNIAASNRIIKKWEELPRNERLARMLLGI